MSAVIDRLQQDRTFRLQYCADPDKALSVYHLNGSEMRALRTGDGLELELLGLGQKWDDFVEALCGPHPGD